MAEGGSLKVEGGARLRRTLRKAGADMKDLTRLHRRVGEIIVPRAVALAPIGPEAGGHIRNNIRATAAQRHATIRAGGKLRPYGPPIHWGWAAHGITAQPWISQAAQETEPRWSSEFMDGIEQIIDQVKGK